MENENKISAKGAAPVGGQESLCCSGHESSPEPKPVGGKNNYLIPVSIVVSAVIVAGAWVYTEGLKSLSPQGAVAVDQISGLQERVLPSDGIILPVVWSDLGKQLTDAGVIDKEVFESIYAERGGLGEYEKKLLSGSDKENLVMTYENSGFILNLLWALGLGNKNDILENGPMSDPRYGGAGKFASTGGWTIAKGDSMNHYSAHKFLELTAEQQKIVERVSKGIFRPCCGNSTYFPDCNHGMAMLGLLELMASQGVSEDEMYKAALQVNSYWFPDTYLNIAKYLEQKGVAWSDVDSKEILGESFSSASGYKRILSQVQPVQGGKSGGCGI